MEHRARSLDAPRPLPPTRGGSDRRTALAVGGLAILRGLPFLALGPKFVLDDWFTLFWAWRDGWLRAAGPTQLRARPLGALVYTLEFGVIGRHPGIIAAIQLLVTAATAVVLFWLARRFLSRGAAAAVAVTWVLLPNHGSLDHWASGSIAQVALLLLLTGLLLMVRAEDEGRAPWAGTVLAAVSAASYEATIVVAAVAVVAIPLLRQHRPTVRRVAWQLATVGAVGVYLLASSYHFERDQGWFSAWAAFPAHFGWALAPSRGLGFLLGIAASVGLTVACVRRWSPTLQARVPEGPARLVIAGLAVIVVGLLPFARYPIEPLGVGDRANVVAAVGAALAWVGLVGLLRGPTPRRRVALVAASVLVAGCFTAQGVQRDLDWHRAGEDADRTLAALTAKAEALPPGTVLAAGPEPRFHNGVVGLIGVIGEHVQAYSRTPGRLAIVPLDRSSYESFDPAHRVDMDALLGPRGADDHS